MRRSCLLLLLCAAGCQPVASVPEIETFGPPVDSLSTDLVELTDAAWLGDSRWAVLSRADARVLVADTEAGTLTPLGAGTLRQPHALFRDAGDTLWVADWQARAVTGWTADGRRVGTLPMPPATRGTLPAARDADGAWYVELRPVAGRDGGGLRDSTWIVRLAPDGTLRDTMAGLAPIDLATVDGARGRRYEPRVLAGRDLWGVHPGGGLWVARVAENRVDWLHPVEGRRRGVSLPDPVIQVTQLDRDLYMERFPPELRSAAGRVPFAVFKPPFDAAFADPSGGVWLEKSKAITDTSRLYLLVDGGGDLARVVRLPGFGRIRAAAPGRVLVGEFDEGHIVLTTRALPAAVARLARAAPREATACAAC